MPVPVVTIAQMRDWEKATWATGQTEREVIIRVGTRVAHKALELTRRSDLVLILAGKGNNGEDARAAVEHLLERRVKLLNVTDPARQLAELEELLAQGPRLVIDGLFGIGINRPLDGTWQRFIQRVNESSTAVLAVDVPSGLNAETGEPLGFAIKACATLTVGAPKTGLLLEKASSYVGRLEVAQDVGLIECPCASQCQWSLPRDFADFPPRRPDSSHKGTYGHVALLGGSLGYHGAAVLLARGAQRAQPGLITLRTLPEVYPVVASQLQAVMVGPWKSSDSLFAKCTGMAIGPGLAADSVPDELKEFTRRLWREATVPLVVDASALAWLPAGAEAPRGVRVITPHPGEASRLLGCTADAVQADRLGALRRLSARFGDTFVVLKGRQTLIGRSAGDVLVNSSGNPHLAQGGSGDLLTGFIAGLLGQPRLQSDPLKALGYAVWQHGASADALQARRGNWVIEELAAELGNH